jgi:hypothetical protein
VRCKTCHYSLANLKEHRCPECGRAFDPNDPTTFHPAAYVPLSKGVLSIIMVIVCVSFMCVVLFYPINPQLPLLIIGAVAMILALGAVHVLHWAHWTTFRPRR